MIKKLFLMLALLNVGMTYAVITPAIQKMDPFSRETLAQSMRESAVAYEAAGRMKKAQQYYRTSLEVYPIGDEAHVLANKLGVVLDDEKTYTDFVQKADVAYQSQDFRMALMNYLMAKQVKHTKELYTKLAQVYTKLNNTVNAQFYKEAADKYVEEQKSQSVKSVENTNSEDMEEEYMNDSL